MHHPKEYQEFREYLYNHHLKQLEKAGIVERTGTQKSGGRSGSIYTLCEREVGADSTDDSSGDERAAMADLGGAILRLTERDMRTALTEGWEDNSTFAGFSEFPLVQRTKAWLTPDEAKHVLAQIEKLLEYMRERSVRDDAEESGARLFALSQVLSPVPARKERRDNLDPVQRNETDGRTNPSPDQPTETP